MWEPVGRDNLATYFPSASAERGATMKLVEFWFVSVPVRSSCQDGRGAKGDETAV